MQKKIKYFQVNKNLKILGMTNNRAEKSQIEFEVDIRFNFEPGKKYSFNKLENDNFEMIIKNKEENIN